MIFSPSIIRGSLTATLLGGLFVLRFCCHVLNAQEPGSAERSLSSPASAPPETVYIQTSKDIFPTRGEARLKITVKDENGRPVRANLGVSVSANITGTGLILIFSLTIFRHHQETPRQVVFGRDRGEVVISSIKEKVGCGGCICREAY